MKYSTKNLLYITLISSLTLLILILIKQQEYSPNTQTLAVTDYQAKSAPATTPTFTKNKELSCSDCLAEGKNTICFNVETNRATCGNINNYTQNINMLCRKCANSLPKPTAYTTPWIKPEKCYYQQSKPEEAPVLICPSITPKYCITALTPAKNLKTNECHIFPNSCLPDGWSVDQTCSVVTTPSYSPAKY